ncbi:MAG TPA: hypothetical protein VGB73_04405 [Pyrinomonadaceae bacterium]|jgi:hypothetical protein
MSILRPLVLSLLILSLVAAGLPISDSLAARWNKRSYKSWRQKHLRHRHSRAWWRRHRAHLRRKRAYAAMRRRALNLPAASEGSTISAGSNSNSTPLLPAKNLTRLPAISKAVRDVRAPFDLTLPASWSSTGASSGGQMKFNVRALDGKPAGSAVLSPINPSKADAPAAPYARVKTLGGVHLSTLRRTVIDRMIAEGGWVVNDVEREIRGRRVYVVFAQTGALGASAQRWTFYFTEVEGRLYQLATNTPVELDAPLTDASEQVVSTFRVGSGQSMAAKSPR